MEIIAGKARGLQLRSPETDAVRPTSVRARRAFFDSLGDLSGMVFADLFAGSGAMGLEAASRGAVLVYFFENSGSAGKVIRQNCARLRRSGVEADFELFECELPILSSRVRSLPKPQIIFADPPYPESMKLLQALTHDPQFREWADESVLYWELPDFEYRLDPPGDPWKVIDIKTPGPARFLLLKQAFPGKK